MTDPTQQELAEARINIGILQTQVGHLTEGMADLQETNRQLTAKLDQVLLTLSEARGGWRTLMAVGGAAATAGAFASWVGQHVKW